MKKTLLVTFVILFSLVSLSYALETDTHEVINEYIAINTLNGFSLDSYLKDNLEFQKGRNEIFNSKKVWEWVKEGGKYEDKPSGCIPYWRSLRHFHNPLTDQGLKGTLESSIQWSQKPAGTQSCGYYSWHDVRGYFYNALTSSAKTERDEKFAQTFRGLGQLMHLVQDLSVPAHTRDDAHILYNYEKWAKDKIKKTDAISENYLPLIFYDPPIGAPNPLAAVPVANLFDTNQYIGSNPGITLQGNIGLSEYTNANFFSLDTAFKDVPYPSRDSVSLDDVAIPDPRYPSGTILRKYFNKMSDGDTGYRLATVSFLQGFEDECAPFCSEWFYELAALDGEVYGDYAEKLIPRAVGYSVGLLNYFFRGKINMVPDEENGDGYIIENKSDEELEGIFRLYYDNESDERVQIESGNFPLEISIPGNDKSSNVNFTIPDNPKEPGKYTLVFRGKLGNEEDAVIGKVVNLSLPYVVVGIGGIEGEPELCTIWNVKSNTKATDLFPEYPVLYSEFANLWKDKMPLSPGGRMFNKSFAGESSLYKGEGDPTSANTGCESLTNEYTDNGQVDVCRYFVIFCMGHLNGCAEDCLICAECDSMSEYCSDLPGDPKTLAWRETMEEGVMKAFQQTPLESFDLEVVTPQEEEVPIGGAGERTCVRNELEWKHGGFSWYYTSHPTWPGFCSLPQQSVSAYDIDYSGYDYRGIWKTPLGDFDEVHTWNRTRHWSFEIGGTVDGGSESESFRYGTTFVNGTYSSNVYVQVYGFLGTKWMKTTTNAEGTVTSYKGEGSVKAALDYYPEGIADISPLSQEINTDFTDAIQELIDSYKERYNTGGNSNNIPLIVEIRQL